MLADDTQMRCPHGGSEDERIRAQRFRRVTRLRRQPPMASTPEMVVFVGEWVAGYQEVHRLAVTYGWIVKRERPRDADAEASE